MLRVKSGFTLTHIEPEKVFGFAFRYRRCPQGTFRLDPSTTLGMTILKAGSYASDA